MASRNPLRGLLSRKLRSLIKTLEEDVGFFGRSRIHVWRGIFTILDELLLENIPIESFLDKIKDLSMQLMLPKEKAISLGHLAYYYRRIGKNDTARNLLVSAINLAYQIHDIEERYHVLATIADYAFRSEYIDLGEKIVDMVLNESSSLDTLSRVFIISKLGKALARYDVGRGDSLVSLALCLAEKCEYTEDIAKGLMRTARTLVEISKDNENVRIAKNWVGKALRALESLDFESQVKVLTEVIGDIFIVSANKAFQIINDVIYSTRSDRFGIEILVKALESAALVKAEDIISRILDVLWIRLQRTTMLNNLEKLSLISHFESFNRFLDTYRADFVARRLSEMLGNAINSVKTDADFDNMLDAIRWYAELNLHDAYVHFMVLLNSKYKNRLEKNAVKKIIEIYKRFTNVFPKAILNETKMIYKTVVSRRENYMYQMIPEMLDIIVTLDNEYDIIVRDSIKLGDLMENKHDRILYLSRIAAALFASNSIWASELLDYCLEEMEELEDIAKAQTLVEISEIISDKNPQKGKELLRNAIRILEKQHNSQKAAKLLLMISQKMREIFEDPSWARQIEMLAREIQRKSIGGKNKDNN